MIGRIINTRYQIDELIGTGGMADVYRARDNLLGRTVSVKVLHPQYAKDPVFIQRFRQEAQSAANLNQPNIVNVYDWGIEGSTYFLVMEYVEGMNLKEIIIDGGPILPERAVEIAISICLALEAAHSRGIVHRDIKPQNVIVTGENQVKVMDFGIARSAGGTAMTQTGTIMGTAQYISPEQAQGRAADPRSDLYSLGIVTYEMLTGRVPFDGESPVAIAYKHVREDPLPPSMINPDISPELEAVVMKSLAKNPENRYQSAVEMRADLERCMEGAPVHATPVLPPGEARVGDTRAYPAAAAGRARRGRSRAWIWALLVLIILSAAGVGAWAIFKSTSGVAVPGVAGKSVEEAKEIIQKAGLAVGKISEEYSEKVPAGSVVSQDPGPGSRVSRGMKVDLVISKGPSLVTVPDCRGLSRGEAEGAIRKAGLEVGRVTTEYSEVPEGKVSSQSPEPGARVARGSEVYLAVSRGPELVVVPELVGLSRQSAEEQLKSKGLAFEVQEVTDTDQPEGTVVSQNPQAGQKAPKGSTVTIGVSTKPEQISVPGVVGKKQQAAVQSIEGAGLKCNIIQRETTDKSKEGIVIQQDPTAGTLVNKGEAVTIIVGVVPG